jgi:endonuclease/exonuclease/phosphatase (EEP) superfamily protein YafD
MAEEDVAPKSRLQPVRARTGGVVGHVLLGGTGLALLALWVAAFAGAWLDAPPIAMVLALTGLPLLAPVLSVAAFSLWTLFPDHRLGGPVVALAALAPLLWWGPVWAGRPGEARSDDVVVLSWNVRRLWGAPGDGGDPLACVRETLAASAADVVVLQEVTTRDLDRLSDALGLQCVHGTYHPDDDDDSAGIAVCEASGRWPLRDGTPMSYPDASDWRFVRASFGSAESTAFSVLGVHLHPYRVLHDPQRALERAADRLPVVVPSQDAQTTDLLEQWLALPEPTLVAGDFNSTRDTPFHARLRRHLTDVLEATGAGFPATVDLLDGLPIRIDFVYASPRMTPVQADVLQAGCSDHRAILSRLRPPTTSP